MKRHEAIEILTRAGRRDDVVSIATMQAVPVWHELAPGLPLHIDVLGCMGAASSLGLGLALGHPARKVLVVDGDGALMMQLGSLVTIGNSRASNLILTVLYNRRYETSGNQPIPGAETADLAELARGAGFVTVSRIASSNELAARIDALVDGPGPTMVVIDVDPEQPSTKWPALSMKQQVQDVRARLSGRKI